MPNTDSHDVFLSNMRQAVKELVTEQLEKFLTDGGQLEGYKDFKDGDVGLTEAQFKDFLEYGERTGKGRYVYLGSSGDPRGFRFKSSKDGLINKVIQHCVDNAVYIWNNGCIEQYGQE